MADKAKKLDDPVWRVVSPIVEGQIRDFCHHHPEIPDAVSWKFSAPTKTDALVNSLAKRIVRDLLCPVNRVRLVAALLESGSDDVAS